MTARAPVALYADTAGAQIDPAVALLEAAGLRVVVAELHTQRAVAERVGALRPVALLTAYAPVTAGVLAAAEGLGLVSCCAAGFDNVDVEAATARGVWVANVPDAAVEEVATHALAMGLGLVRHLPFLDRQVRAGGWDDSATGLPRRLSVLTLGVIGAGRIGRQLLELGRPLFGRVVCHDPLLAAADLPAGVEWLALEDCLAAADVLSLHLPMVAGRPPLIDRAALARMRQGAFLVNVSRGGLVDPVGLLEALDAGRLAGAALDVTSPEPPGRSDPLRSHPRIVLTPHAAYLSEQSARAYVTSQAENVLAWLHSGRPRTPVNEPAARAG